MVTKKKRVPKDEQKLEADNTPSMPEASALTDQNLPAKPKRAKRSAPRSDHKGEQAVSASTEELTDAHTYEERKPALPVVGIGASAGGLEAFEKFFTNMPSDSGMAFVVVQHLDPTHKSILAELVRRYTNMDVFEVEDGMKVEANCVYIIPPNRDMAILDDRLHLMEPSMRRELRLPIDFFFRSLAEDQGERAIGIVLSGTGTEGAQGIRAIKGEGGMAMVQDPETAKYDGMPRNAIVTGMADYILPPEKMPQQLLTYVRHAFGKNLLKVKEPAPKTEKDLLNKIFVMLRTQTGHDFSHYKQNTIIRRISRRMTVHQITRLNDYVRFLQQNPAEIDTLFKELLIGITNFFRDAEAWEVLREKVIPRLFEERQPEQTVRVWVPGCSTGEEAYSIAILAQEYLDETKGDFKIQVFATDIDSEAIEKGRLGIFPESIAVDVSQERLARFFNHEDAAYQIKRSIRDQVVFAVQNVVKDPPFSKLDMISCRNLLIYMQPELQKRIMPLFHYALNQSGFLFLGNSESVNEFFDLFTVLDRKWKIFRAKRTSVARGQAIEFLNPLPMGEGVTVHTPVMRREGMLVIMREVVERTMLKQYTPTSIIINDKGEVLYVHGHTGKYLELPTGEMNLNLLNMVREGLKIELTNALRKAVTQKQKIVSEGIQIKQNGEMMTINLTVAPMLEPPEMRDLIMVVIQEVAIQKPAEGEFQLTPGADHDAMIAKLERELRTKEEYLQTTIEELETSNEELKSTNEEFQSSNEELQSTNEELETSKEELQSVNEELVTVNIELQKKIEQLSQSYNDMNNLLASTEIGTVFLDQHLRVMRFTPSITQVMPLIQSDIGRPISDITTNMIYSQLSEDVETVLRTLVFKEVEIQTKIGQWYWMRIMPYRTLENVIDGVVITLVNITKQKEVQHELNKLKRAVEQSNSAVMITNVNGDIEYVNPRFSEVSGYKAEDVLGKNPRLLKSGQHSAEFYAQLWGTLNKGETWRGEFIDKKKNGTIFRELATISPVKDELGHVTHFIAVMETAG